MICDRYILNRSQISEIHDRITSVNITTNSMEKKWNDLFYIFDNIMVDLLANLFYDIIWPIITWTCSIIELIVLLLLIVVFANLFLLEFGGYIVRIIVQYIQKRKTQ
jgi:hypothetical protein